MTRPDDEFPPLDVTSTLNLGALDEVLEGPDTDVVPSRMSGSLPPGLSLSYEGQRWARVVGTPTQAGTSMGPQSCTWTGTRTTSIPAAFRSGGKSTRAPTAISGKA